MLKLLVANWKAYITSKDKAKKLISYSNAASEIGKCNVVVCPPYVYLSEIRHGWDIEFGVQDLFWQDEGAYTGEITPSMLNDFGVNYAILGHSERRNILNETDEMINKKVLLALKHNLKVILCVGEKQREHDGVIPEFVAEQVKKALFGVPKSKIRNVIVAYEPIWAIGSGSPDTPDDASKASLYIKKTVSKMFGVKSGLGLKVLYGGSVNSENILDFLSLKEIDGVLVGSASTKKDEFVKMIKLTERL